MVWWYPKGQYATTAVVDEIVAVFFISLWHIIFGCFLFIGVRQKTTFQTGLSIQGRFTDAVAGCPKTTKVEKDFWKEDSITSPGTPSSFPIAFIPSSQKWYTNRTLWGQGHVRGRVLSEAHIIWLQTKPRIDIDFVAMHNFSNIQSVTLSIRLVYIRTCLYASLKFIPSERVFCTRP